MNKPSLKRQFFQVFILMILFILVLIYGIQIFKYKYPFYLVIIFDINLLFLYFRIFLSLLYRIKIYFVAKKHSNMKIYSKISVIVPCYNESAELVKKLFESLEKQTLKPYEIIFIDDASSNPEAYYFIKNYAQKSNLKIRINRGKINVGKLISVYRGIIEAKGDYLMFIDSDGIISRNCLHELLAPFYFMKHVGGTCGQVVPLNSNINFLTKMETNMYVNAYNSGRSYQSFFGKVLVCSGTISMFKRQYLMNNIHLLLKSKLSRKDRLTGDDIIMTNIILRQRLSTLYVENAICYTTVPDNFYDFYKQQLRWTRDAYFSYLEEIGSVFRRPIFFILETSEVYYWLISLGALVIYYITGLIPLFILTILSMMIFDLLSTFMDSYYLIFIKKQKFRIVLLQHYFYNLILLIIRSVSLVSFTHHKWERHKYQIKKKKKQKKL